METELGNINRQIKEKNTFIKSITQKIINLTEEAKRIAHEVKIKLKELASFENILL